MSLERYGSYDLVKRLATGGMAQIYLARQGGEGAEKLLVVKRILPHLGENVDFVRMFLDEARIAARLNHPNIVQIFNLGAQDDSYFIAMEYIHGEDVRRVWKRSNQLGRVMPVPLVCRVIMDACAGLDYAHKKADASGKPLNIVHRDISPQNILVTFEGGVKVVDFGIAKAADQATVTRSGVLKGKYSYMSPEQAAGKRLDCRSDIFALGVVLWELLTGSRLFKRANDIQTLNAVSDCEVDPPSSVNPALSQDLDAVVLKALAKTPEGRYQEAAELGAALEKWVGKHKLPASPSDLAAFMQEIYAERLAAERKAGQVLVEDADALKARDDDPNGKMPRSKSKATGSVKEKGSLASPVVDPALLDATVRPEHPEDAARPARAEPSRQGSSSAASAGRTPASPFARGATPAAAAARATAVALDPEVAVTEGPVDPDVTDRPHDPPAWSVAGVTNPPPPSDLSAPFFSNTEGGGATARSIGPQRRAQIALFGLAAAVVIGVALGGLYLWRRKPADDMVVAPVPVRDLPARVKIVSEPPGATVLFNGAPVPEPTPCTLPPTEAGTYVLVVGKAGYLDYRTTITIPKFGEPNFPLIRLQSEAEAGPRKVSLTFKSDPTGSTLSVNGAVVGKTPRTIEARAGDELAIKLDHPGYYSLLRQQKVTADPDQVPMLKLERISGDHPAERPPDRRPPERVTKEPEPKPVEQPRQGRAFGTVRFVATPWAEVSCGEYKFGPTPFPDQHLPVGIYDCRFTNPQHGTRTERVEVRANFTSRVTVKF